MLKYKIIKKFNTLDVIVIKYWLLVFYIASICYWELIYRLWNFNIISPDYIFPVLFALSAGAVLFLISSLLQIKANRIITIFITLLLTLCYSTQLVYYCIFHTPLSFSSLAGAKDALQFMDIIIPAILKNIFAIAMLFVPFLFLLVFSKKLSFYRKEWRSLYIVLCFCIVSYTVSIICMNFTDEKNISQRTLYFKVSSPEISVMKLGLLTTVRLDIERFVFGFEGNNNDEKNTNTNYNPVDSSIAGSASPISEPSSTKTNPSHIYNIMDIDFKTLIANEKNQVLLDMHKYFSSVKPTKKNKYTGIFKGNNLILITAEAFSPYAISPEFTPTLYKMSREGFVFNNFYNPVWSVSTSDGEYVACTGLIPKSGVWSFAASGKNYMPFVMGNQFKNLGYTTKAYHNHSYKYYKRDISHPNMGYDYKGVGNGLNVKNTWPESDLEMIEVTIPEFINSQPFHTYYMTVSGHMNYSFAGNYIAQKNKHLVEKLPYSDASKAYIAANLEFEFAVKALIDKLDAAGIADKTVIAISADHYPYGLPRKCIDELAGHKVEDNFELYKSTFILWKKGMNPVVINKPCSSLDIIPTLSNLFGLKYDSRLLMGRDILSDAPPLVIFSNRSWITDKAMYNTVTNTVTYKDHTQKDTTYVRQINKIVNDKFKYSAKILETDYYSKVVSKAFK